MRQSFHEYAGESVKHSFWARAFYQHKAPKAKGRQAAVRGLSLQVDQNHLEVLANPHPLKRGEVFGRSQKEGFTLVVLRCEKRCLSQNLLTRRPQMDC
jgi:hypothetical protein